ncbi:response regulator [Sedimenticola sp.]|uniref:response regulator n=1 Tax=Sedimenticola sp. TaxID=1940285 RepID=UPI003D104453
MQRALIVEDTPEARDWMADALGSVFPGITVRLAASVAEASDRLDRCRYDLALIDLHLPDGNGVDLIARINSESPQTLCVVVTIYDDDQHLFPALQAGAGGYLLKDMPGDQFVRRLRGIADGEPPLSPAIARRLLGHFGTPAPELDHDLTPREREVLTLIAKGIKLADVAEALSISRHTAGDHVKSIYRKLNISSRAEATLEAARLGFIKPG